MWRRNGLGKEKSYMGNSVWWLFECTFFSGWEIHYPPIFHFCFSAFWFRLSHSKVIATFLSGEGGEEVMS